MFYFINLYNFSRIYILIVAAPAKGHDPVSRPPILPSSLDAQTDGATANSNTRRIRMMEEDSIIANT